MFKRRSIDVMNVPKKSLKKNEFSETLFVRVLNRLFRAWGKAIACYPKLFIGASFLLTAFCSLQIPLTPMSNDVADFTPYGARARKEIEAYEAFFSNKGDPILLFLLITAKSADANMLGVDELGEAVQLLNIINDRFKVHDAIRDRNLSFAEFCDNFCTINEPVRHFHSGLLLERNFGNSSLEHIDLGYPVTTVLGRQLHMDPHFFGVKIAVRDGANGSNVREVSVNEVHTGVDGDGQQASMFDSPAAQVPNNIRAISLVGLHFRAVRPLGVSQEAIKDWQRSIAHFVRHEFNGQFVDALILSETLLTDEVVRAGLTLLPFLVIGFAIMVTFSSMTMGIAALYMGQMGAHKIILAIIACSCPFMACGTALGGMFWCGFRFGSLLCVTPFLVLALGVDDAYLMLNSWQRLLKRMEHQPIEQKEENCEKSRLVQTLMAEVMVDTGASITITTLTNVLAFAIGAATPTPEIRLFSIGNALAITVVYVYQWTIFGSAMALFGEREFRTRQRHHQPPPIDDNNPPELTSPDTTSASSEVDSGINVRGSLASSVSDNSSQSGGGNGRRSALSRAFRRAVQRWCKRFLRFYCAALANCWVGLGVLALLAAYMYASIYGLLTIRAELKPEQLFLRSSDVQRILQLRNDFVMPFYAVCLVFVNRPGNFSDPVQRQKLHSLVADFEALPSSVGRFATKFWLRDYEQFVESESTDEAAPLDDLATFEGISLAERHKNELAEFLQWPEFQFWNGFIQLEHSADNKTAPTLSRFFFSTASYGAELKYPELEVSVYEDEAKFLDLIPTMIPQTLQSAICTLLCMFLVCLLFMTNPASLLVSNFAIFSTCIGVFGIQSLMGTALDPIFMSAAIMSIGFSVDIPAHIAYHFYKTGTSDNNPDAKLPSVEERLRECLAAIAFPVLEAGLSTLVCTSSLFFVDLHMARVFACTMTLVVAIGLLHGLLVIPVMLCQLSNLWPSSQPQQLQLGQKPDKSKASAKRQQQQSVLPIVLAVNQHDKF